MSTTNPKNNNFNNNNDADPMSASLRWATDQADRQEREENAIRAA